MYYQFNTQQFYVLPSQCIYVFCVNLRTISGFYNRYRVFTARYGLNIYM